MPPRRASAPAFQFYPQAWHSSRKVQAMTFAEKGMYLELLLEQWEHGGVPATPEVCAQVIGGHKSEWKRAWKKLNACFTRRNRDGLAMNAKMEAIRRALNRYRKAQAVSGLRGATARWKDHGKPIGSPSTRMANDGSLSLSLSSTVSVPTEVQELRTPRQSARPMSVKPSVLRKLIYTVVQAHPDAAYVDLKDLAKDACAKQQFVYDAQIVGDALDQAMARAAKGR